MSAERARLAEDDGTAGPWKLRGPHLSERQWSTVREDHWTSFPHDHGR